MFLLGTEYCARHLEMVWDTAQYVLININEFQLLKTWLWKSVLIITLNNWPLERKNMLD